MGFTAYIVLVAIIYILGIVALPFKIMAIIAIVPTIMFCLRRISVIVQMKTIITTEITLDVILTIVGLIFSKLTVLGWFLYMGLRAIFILIGRHHDQTYIIIEQEDIL